MANVLVIPHVGISGGAGLYINQVLSEIIKSHNVYVGGIHSSSFDFEEYKIDSSINNVVIPYYKGISPKAYLFYCFKSLIYIPKNYYLLNKKSDKDNFHLVLLTSGIQVLLIPIIKKYFRNAKVIILVQENFRLDGCVMGYIVKRGFLKADLIVSITKDWKSYSKSFGVQSILFRNMFTPAENDTINVISKDIDFIYLGGDQKIKGFSDIVDFCQKMSEIKSFRIAVLGELSTDSKRRLLEITNSSKICIDIMFFGFLKNTTDLIRRSKVLLLPITSPHFCRPAIEAGFEHIPFLIRRHDSISDFAIEGYNCEMYDDLEEMIDKSVLFLENDNYIKELGSNNYKISTDFIYDGNIGDSFLKAVEDILK